MLGQALVEAFSDQEVLAWDREEIDITDFDQSRQKLLSVQPEVIINAAAMTDVDACEDQRELADKLNGQAPGHLAVVVNELSATLVQFSTSYVFDGQSLVGYTEKAIPNPISVYGQTKLEGERGAAFAKKHYILRLDRLFGKPGNGKKSFVDKIQEAANSVTHDTNPNRSVAAIDDEFGCLTYAPDLAKRTRYILDNRKPDIYHTTNEGTCSWYDAAKEIFKIKQIDVKLDRVPASTFTRKARRPHNGTLLNTKLPPMRSWQEALKECLVEK